MPDIVLFEHNGEISPRKPGIRAEPAAQQSRKLIAVGSHPANDIHGNSGEFGLIVIAIDSDRNRTAGNELMAATVRQKEKRSPAGMADLTNDARVRMRVVRSAC